MDDLVSVIVTVYNTEKYLKECLTSIKNQTHENIEVLIIDDGSTDKSPSIIKSFIEEDSRFKVITTKNFGSWHARNIALETAKGEFLFFVDSDDFIDTKTIKKLHTVLKASDTDIAACAYEEINEDGSYHSGHYWKDGALITPSRYYDHLCSQEQVVLSTVSWGKLWKKELYEGLKFPNVKCGQDANLIHYLIDRSKAIYILDETLYKYRRRNDATSRKRNIGSLDEIIPFIDRAKFFIDKNRKALAEKTMIIAENNYLYTERLAKPKDEEYKKASAKIKDKIISQVDSMISVSRHLNIKTKLLKTSFILSYIYKKMERID